MPVPAADIESNLNPRPPIHESGGILLISCYEMGHQPLAAILPYSSLEDAGFSPSIIDLAVQDLDPEMVRRAQLVAISVPMHTALRIGVKAAEQVRQLNRTCHICIYGLYASLNAEYLLEHCADSCVGGNSEETLLAIARSIASDSPLPSTGVYTEARPAQPVLIKQAPVRLRRTGVPSIDRYARLEHNDETLMAGYVEATRGCLHHCRHCPIPPVYSGRLFVFSAENVLDDIDSQVRAGAAHITFGDPDFLNGPSHSLAIVRELHRRHPAVTFDATVKVEHILERPEIFRELKECGCLFIVSAVESLSENVLAVLEKGHTREDIVRALDILRRAGIVMRPTWVAFTPWTRRADYLDMLEFIESQDLIDSVDPVQYSIRLLVPPGSLLLDTPEMQPYLGPLQQELFSYSWTHPDPLMDRLQEDVAALVERDSAGGADPLDTFHRVQGLAADLFGKVPRRPRPAVDPNRKRSPRLSESWFC